MDRRLPVLVLVAAPAALLALASRAPSSSGGLWFQDVARDISATAGCGLCHEPAPGAPPPEPPLRVFLEPARRALASNEAIAVTLRSIGGQSASPLGGFAAEASAGAFANGTQTRLWNGATAITHAASSPRNWTFGFVAPAGAGPVELYAVVNTVDDNRRSGAGDFWASHGWDGAQWFSTPVWLYVLAGGIVPYGSACAGGYDNVPVLGGREAPAAGNAGFALELHGAAPGAAAFLLLGANPGFVPIDLAPLGAPGCTLLVDPALSLTVTTSSGVPQRGDGAARFALPLPADASLRGAQLQAQAAVADPAARRALPLTLTNGLRVTIR
jgi:hypothetical protein